MWRGGERKRKPGCKEAWSRHARGMDQSVWAKRGLWTDEERGAFGGFAMPSLQTRGGGKGARMEWTVMDTKGEGEKGFRASQVRSDPQAMGGTSMLAMVGGVERIKHGHDPKNQGNLCAELEGIQCIHTMAHDVPHTPE